MTSKQWAGVLVLIVLPAPAAAETGHHAHTYDFESFRIRMEDPARAQWQKPAEVVTALRLHRGDRVADIGAGTGYFTALLAQVVGESGTVYAADIDTRAVRYMRSRFRREKAPQIRVIQASADDPKLPARVDLIFICDTWHHIEHRIDYARRLRRSLRKNGRLVIVDFKPDADPTIGPPKEMRVSAEQISDELRQGGFRVAQEPDFLPMQYMLTATVGQQPEPNK